jgi:hypothetical protein
MRTIELKLGQWLYTERMNRVDDDETIAQLRKDRASLDYHEAPIYVVPYDISEQQYALYNGNHQALLAQWESRPLIANVVENVEDYQRAESDQPTTWAGQSSSATGSDPEARYSAALVAIRTAADELLQRRQRKSRPSSPH